MQIFRARSSSPLRRSLTMKRPGPGLREGTPASPRLIGWKEYVGFPDWDVAKVKAKVDTGARTSALGVVSYELRQADGLGLVAQLRLAFQRNHPERILAVHAQVLRMVVVRNSTGMYEQRPLIETEVCLGGVCKRVQFTITNRVAMRFPIILGRKALAGDFVVDVSKRYLLQS